MALSINTNIASLQAQNNLNQVNKALEQNQERLSSGLRINSAADDAAGLAISDRMNAQIKGMNQASRNASDGISMAQTAEGGMQEITNILQRMREIAVQSANETNTESDRESLNQEFEEIRGELDRIASSTSFNGQNILDGTLGDAQFQVGPDTGEDQQISVDFSSSMESDSIGQKTISTLNLKDQTAATGSTVATVSANELSIDGTQLSISDGTTAKGETQSSAHQIAKAINGNDDIEVDAEALGTVSDASSNTRASATTGSTYTLSINGTAITSGVDIGTEDLLASDVIDKINDKSDTTAVSATQTDGGSIELSAEEGRSIKVTEKFADDGTSLSGAQGFFQDAGSNSGTYTSEFRGEISLTSNNNVKVSDNNTEVEFQLDGEDISASGTKTAEASNLDVASVDSVTNAENAIQRIDEAINDVDTFRATMGAAQNRMESTISNLENSAQNLTEARSRIRDADIAKEAADQTQNNVRRQAAASVLTQANQSPQLALQLLGG